MFQIDDADLVDGDMIFGGLSSERESECQKGTGDVYRVYPTIFLPIDSLGRFLPAPFSRLISIDTESSTYPIMSQSSTKQCHSDRGHDLREKKPKGNKAGNNGRKPSNPH